MSINGDVMSDVDLSNINDESLTTDPTGAEVCQLNSFDSSALPKSTRFILVKTRRRFGALASM